MMTIIVCGGTRYADRDRLYSRLDGLRAEHGAIELISSCARGADRLARDWAGANNIAIKRFPARMNEPDGVNACNVEMLTVGKPNVVLAFRGGPGTAHMINIAQAAGVPVINGDGT